MWTYQNPVAITFGADWCDRLESLVGQRRYLLITYPDAHFTMLADRMAQCLGAAAGTICDVAPNPDIADLARQAALVAANDTRPEVIIALGGGSVIDSAKVLAASAQDFSAVEAMLSGRGTPDGWRPLPLIAVPTTAGTGSEVTCWATVWDREAGTKRSLDHPALYPEAAVIDPDLMRSMPRALTVSTGLDALSHALESLWNRNANPVTATHAVVAARTILEVLPALVMAPNDPELRSRMAEAALSAGLAFSGTRTAIAHSISYPVTLRHGVTHGIACAFTLPMILHSLADADGLHGRALRDIFGPDLRVGAGKLATFLEGLGVGLAPADYGIDAAEWENILAEATDGPRGRNFIGATTRLHPVAPRAA